MKTKFNGGLACVAILCLTAPASAQTTQQKEDMIHKAFASEGRCLDLGDIAAVYAEKREQGIAEGLLLKAASSVGSWSDRVYRDIVKLVYTMQLDGAMARQLVYVNCVSGKYNPTVKEIEKGMGKK